MQEELTVILLCLQLELDFEMYVHMCAIHVRTVFLEGLYQGSVRPNKYSLVGLFQARLLQAFGVCYVTALPWVFSAVISGGTQKFGVKLQC